MLVEVRDATFGYVNRAVVHVDQIDLTPGKCLGIFGPNGVGKTTLVRGVIGLLAPSTGTVVHRPDVRLGYLPQHRAMELHWPMMALDAASMAVSARTRLGWMRRDREIIREAMRAMNVEELAPRPFSKLSGGQQQRVLLAGALAARPNVLVLDEVTSGLDVRSRHALLQALGREIQNGLCAVMISHEVEDLMSLTHEIAWLHWPDDPAQPSQIEVISAEELANRVIKVRRAS